MLRLFVAGLMFACGVTQVLADPPAPADDNAAQPMRFEWRQEGPAQVCGSDCRTWMSAVGYVTSDTSREFEAFAQDHNVRGAVLVLDSDGGSVLGTLTLGRTIRRLDMVTTVGRTTALPPAPTARATRRCRPTPIVNRCARSCCWPGRVVTCRPRRRCWCIRSGSGRSASARWNRAIPPRSSTSSSAISADWPSTRLKWAAIIELLEAALQVPPWEPLRLLSAAEIERMRLSTVEALFTADAPRQSPTASAGSVATVGRPTSPQN